MFFKKYFISVADCLHSKFESYEREGQNSADKGELGETFLKEFLYDSVGDNFKIFRGGKIIDHENNASKQLDVVLCGKRTIKIFGDKGIYPIETVYGVFSITATLSKEKMLDCIEEFKSIPKENFDFTVERFVSQDYLEDTKLNWKLLFPFKCVFAYKGTISENMISDMKALINSGTKPEALPDIIIVNKKGMIEKRLEKTPSGEPAFTFNYIDFNNYPNYGVCFSKILFDLYNLSGEEFILKPQYEKYFNKDIES